MTEEMVALLAAEMDEAWDTLRRRLEGLTDEETFWEPVSGCWTVHLREDGRWIVDYADPAPNPPPFTTIAWRLVHVAACKVMYHEYAFGAGKLTWNELEIPHTAVDAIAWLEEGHTRLRAALNGLSDADLQEMRPTNWGELWPTWRIFWTMVCHDLHHGAEIGCLRDLYRAARGSAGAIEEAISEAEALSKTGQRKEAIEKLEAARRRFGDDLDILRRLARTYFYYMEADVEQKVVDLCEEILRIEPQDVETRLLLAMAYQVRLLDYEKAKEEHRKVIEIDPSSVEAYVGIAGVFPNAGTAEEALEALQKAIELQPDSGGLYGYMARIHRYTGEYEKELELREKALEKGVFDEMGTRRRIEELKEKLKKG